MFLTYWKGEFDIFKFEGVAKAMFTENFITLSSLLEKKCLRLSSNFLLLWQTGKEANETQVEGDKNDNSSKWNSSQKH